VLRRKEAAISARASRGEMLHREEGPPLLAASSASGSVGRMASRAERERDWEGRGGEGRFSSIRSWMAQNRETEVGSKLNTARHWIEFPILIPYPSK
jgi:hypothetical protein